MSLLLPSSCASRGRPGSYDERIGLYVVGHFDHLSRWSLIASELEREAALQLASEEAQRRSIGRMFLAGSEAPRDVIAIAEDIRSPLYPEHVG